MKNTALLTGGNVIAQIMVVISSPILSRLYTPEDFGLLGSILTIAGIVSVVASLKYETAIVLSENDKEASALTYLSLVLLVVITLLTFFILWLCPEVLIKIGLKQTNIYTVFLISLLMMLMGGYKIGLSFHNFYENYILLGTNRIVQKMIIIIVQIILAILIGQGLGLVYGNIAGFAGSLFLLGIPLVGRVKSLPTNISSVIKVAQKHYRFALYSTPQNLINSVSQGLPILMLGRYFSAVDVGFYFFSIRLLQLPSSIIGNSIRQVFYKRAADIKNNPRKLQQEFSRTTLGLLGIIIIPIFVIFIWGPDLFSFIFGNEWEKAGEFAVWMILWVGIGFINPPSLAMLYVLNKQKQHLIFEIFLLSGRFMTLMIGGLSGDIIYTIKLYSIVGLIFNIVFIGYAYLSIQRLK